MAPVDRSETLKNFPPGPNLPAPVILYHWFQRTHAFLDACAERYGDAFTLKLPGMPKSVVLHHPDAIKELLALGPDDAHSGKLTTNMGTLFGKYSLLLLDGPEHKRQRKLLMPPLHGERMSAYGTRIMEIIAVELDKWPLGRVFPVHESFQAMTLDFILRVVFGLDDPHLLQAVRARILDVLATGINPWLLVPGLQRDLGAWSPFGKFVRAVRAADEIIYEEIDRRRAEQNRTRDDILSLLIDARDEDGNPMKNQELRDELMTLVVTGHETTATTLAWALRWILATPDVYARLRDELTRGEISAERLMKLPLLDATVRETLRLQPVFPLIGRVFQRPVSIGGVDFDAGGAALGMIYLTHRRPDLYPNPELFNPDRFLARKYRPHEWVPFGGGHRLCVGMALSLYEIKLVLGMALSRFSMRLSPAYHPREVRRALTVAPSEGVPILAESATAN
jgi:cytochrome P450